MMLVSDSVVWPPVSNSFLFRDYFIIGAIRVGIGKSIRKMTNRKNMNNTKKTSGIIIL